MHGDSISAVHYTQGSQRCYNAATPPLSGGNLAKAFICEGVVQYIHMFCVNAQQ